MVMILWLESKKRRKLDGVLKVYGCWSGKQNSHGSNSLIASESLTAVTFVLYLMMGHPSLWYFSPLDV